MKKLFLMFLVFPIILSAQENLIAFGVKIMYKNLNTEKWKKDRSESSALRNSGMISYKHVPIRDSVGRTIEPMIAIIYEKLPSDSIDLILFSAQKRMNTRFEVDQVFSRENFNLKCKNTVGYYGHYEKGVVHKVIVAHMVFKDVGLQIICDSTEEVYDQVNEDMERFVSSVDIQGK